MTIPRQIFEEIEVNFNKPDLDAVEKLIMPLVEQYPDDFDVLHNLAVYQFHRGQFLQALQTFQTVLTKNPYSEPALFNYACCLYGADRKEEALSTLRRIIALNSNHSTAIFVAGDVAYSIRKYREAGEFFDRYLSILPHKLQEMLPKLVMCWQWAEAQEPDNIEVKLKLYDKLSQLPPEDNLKTQMHEVRLRALHCDPQRFVDKYPDDAMGIGALVSRKLMRCDWGGIDEYIAKLRLLIATTDQCTEPVFNLIGTTQEEQHVNITCYVKWRYPQGIAPKGKITPKGRIKIGYLSSDFHEHATSYLIASLFEHHDRERFAIYGYSCGNEDNSPMRGRLRAAMESFNNIRGLAIEDACQKIKDDEIDILVDLKGWTTGNCMDIVAQRPAPVCVHYLGYPSTTGICDYILADRWVIPEHNRKWFSEEVIYLPGSYQINDDHCETGKECPRPHDGYIYANFNQPYKITPDSWSKWMQLLKGNPHSMLWQYIQHPESLEILRQRAKEHGIDPLRIVEAKHIPHAEHLARFKHVDEFLDTHPVSGHTTMSDAIRMGVPKINYRKGDTFISNVAESLMANSEDLFDAEKKTRQIEAAYEKIARDNS